MQNINNSKTYELDFERIRILYDNIKFSYLGVVSGVIMLYFVLVRYSSAETALYWVLIVTIANIPRLIVSFQFARKINAQIITRENIRPWEHYISITSIFAYVSFMTVMFLPYGENEVIGVTICAFVLMIMTTGVVLVLSTSLASTLIYVTLACITIVTKFLLLEDPLYTILALIFFLGYFQLLRLIITQNRILIENITLKIENNEYSLTDPLTKLWNRRRLDLHIEKLVPASRRSGDPFSVIMLDIDHFKKYNDTYGHIEGDKLLVKIADSLRMCSREQDLVVRYGGEEFIVLLPLTRLKDSEIIADRILATVRNNTSVTISAGIAEYKNDINFEQLVDKADQALYAAKENGRDQYITAGS